MADNKEAYGEVIVEVVRRELSNAKKMLTALVIVSILLAASLIANGILVYELFTLEVVEVKETYEIESEGDDNNFVTGNQYNDSAVHNEGAGE